MNDMIKISHEGLTRLKTTIDEHLAKFPGVYVIKMQNPMLLADSDGYESRLCLYHVTMKDGVPVMEFPNLGAHIYLGFSTEGSV